MNDISPGMHISEEDVEKELMLIATNRKNKDVQSWKRKMANLDKLIEEIRPIEDKILKIMIEEKQPIEDKIDAIRSEMVADCVHPRMFLIHKGSYVECKFCNRKIYLVKK
jgi:hypothetical protein